MDTSVVKAFKNIYTFKKVFRNACKTNMKRMTYPNYQNPVDKSKIRYFIMSSNTFNYVLYIVYLGRIPVRT
jgi:hypothetical protein